MTLLGAGFDHGGDLQRSRRAAASHALVSGLDRDVPIPWTPGNVLRLIGVLAVAIGAVAALTHWSVAAYRDEVASRTVVHEYFVAIRSGDVDAGFTIGCAVPPLHYEDWGMPDIADALSAASLAESGVVIEPHHDGLRGIRYHDFEVPGRARGTVQLRATGDPAQPWWVCGMVGVEAVSPT